MKAKPIRKVLALWVLTIVCRGTAIAAVVFELEGVCEFDCDVIGLDVGDSVGGLIGFRNAAITPNANVVFVDTIPRDDAFIENIEFMELSFGNFSFDLSSLGVFFGRLDSTATVFDSFDGFADSAAGYSFDNDLWRAGPRPSLVASGANPTLRALVPVPEPASIVLFVVGLTILGYRPW